MVIQHQQKIDPEAVKSMYPEHVPGKYVAQDNDIDRLAESYLHKRSEADRLKEEAEEIKTYLMAVIKDSEGVFTKFGAFTYKKSKDTTKVNYKALVDFLNPPQKVIQQFIETVPGTRRFICPEK
jgi:hypothetical protein